VSGSDGFVRLRPSSSPGEERVPDADADFEAYLLKRRDTMAEELREIERILLARGLITRLLCAPGRAR